MKSAIFILLLAVAIYSCDALMPKTSFSKTKKGSAKAKMAPSPMDTMNKSLMKNLDKNSKTLSKYVAQATKNSDYYVNKIALDTTEAQADINDQIQSIINTTKGIYGISQDTAAMNNIDVSECSAAVSKMYENAKALEDEAAACMTEKISASQKIGEQIKALTEESMKNFEDMKASTATCSAGFLGSVDEENALACLQKINTKALVDSYATIPMAKLQIEAQIIQLKIAKTGIFMCLDLEAQQKFSEESYAMAAEVKNCMDLKITPPATAAPPTPSEPMIDIMPEIEDMDLIKSDIALPEGTLTEEELKTALNL